MSKRIPKEVRLLQARNNHNNYYDYSLWPDNISLTTKVDILCPKHGKFKQLLKSHLYGRGCRMCAQTLREQTNIKRLGVKFPIQHNDVKKKYEQTMLQRFGVKNPTQNVEIKKAIKKRNIEKYGVDHPFKTETVKQKRKQSFLERVGVEHPMQHHIPHNILSKLKDKNWLHVQHFIKKKSLTQISKELGIHRNTVSNPYL